MADFVSFDRTWGIVVQDVKDIRLNFALKHLLVGDVLVLASQLTSWGIAARALRKGTKSPVAILFGQVEHVGLLFGLVFQILGEAIREDVFIFHLVLDNFVIFDFLFIDLDDLVNETSRVISGLLQPILTVV